MPRRADFSPLRPSHRVSAAFIRAQPGDILTDPSTEEPVGRVVARRHAIARREHKPTRYTLTLTLEDLDA